jgi:CheY-like chemotaxis protein
MGMAESTAQILVAEDDPELRWLLARALRREGYDVLEFEDGRALLAVLQAAPGETMAHVKRVVVSDVCMPVLDGLELVRCVRQASLPTPIILLTGFAESALRARALGLGATAVLDKPVDLPALRGVVGRCIRAPRR